MAAALSHHVTKLSVSTPIRRARALPLTPPKLPNHTECIDSRQPGGSCQETDVAGPTTSRGHRATHTSAAARAPSPRRRLSPVHRPSRPPQARWRPRRVGVHGASASACARPPIAARGGRRTSHSISMFGARPARCRASRSQRRSASPPEAARGPGGARPCIRS